MLRLRIIFCRSIRSNRSRAALLLFIAILQTMAFTLDARANELARKKDPICLPANGLLSPQVRRGLVYLISQQEENGGWSQGQESAFMGHVDNNITNLPNVGDTCMAAVAFMQAGNYPNAGTYSKNVNKAISFICNTIEKSDNNSLSITDVQGTRLQMKLGPYIDTFLASLALSEARGHMLDKAGERQVSLALNMVVHKIEQHQESNGKLAAGGWAPVHAQSLATKGLNRAKQTGIAVREDVLAKAEQYAKDSFDSKTAHFAAAGSPVPLYAAGATLSELQASINTNNQSEDTARKILANKKSSQSDRELAQSKLYRFKATKDAQKQAISAVVSKLDNDGFVRGFGCNGGEEFLSYLDISETLKANDTKEWQKWNQKISDNLYQVQNNDGSWMGQHCITSRTFCTAAALLVLTADRSQMSVVKKLRS